MTWCMMEVWLGGKVPQGFADIGSTCLCGNTPKVLAVRAVQDALPLSGLSKLEKCTECIAVPIAHCSSISCPLCPQWHVLAVHALNDDMLLQINVSFFIVPNAYVLYNHCGVFAELVAVSGIIRWTCWNTVRA